MFLKNRFLIGLIGTVLGTIIGYLLYPVFGLVWDPLFEKKPDTTVYEMLTSNGPALIISNTGKALDKIKVKYTLADTSDSIVSYLASETGSLSLLGGGIGNNYIIFYY